MSPVLNGAQAAAVVDEMRQRILRKARSRATRCRYCGALMLFARDKDGKLFPVEWDDALAHKQRLCPEHVIHECPEQRALEIQLSSDEWRACVEYEKRVLAMYEQQGLPNYTGVNAKHRYAIGEAGERAFEHWLQANGISYQGKPQAEKEGKQSGEYDFRLWVQGDWRSIDVKTTRKKDCMRFIESQFQKRQNVDIYVAATIRNTRNGPVVALKGWLTRKQAETLGRVKIETFNEQRTTVREIRFNRLPYPMGVLQAKAAKVDDNERTHLCGNAKRNDKSGASEESERGVKARSEGHRVGNQASVEGRSDQRDRDWNAN